MKLITGLRCTQTSEYQNAGNQLGDHGSNGYARHIHMKHDHEDQIQYGIYNTGNNQKDQWTFRISYSPQNRSSIIIKHKKRHTQKIDLHIQCRLSDHIIRCTHQFQSPSGKNQSHKCHDDTAYQCKSYSRMNGI